MSASESEAPKRRAQAVPAADEGLWFYRGLAPVVFGVSATPWRVSRHHIERIPATGPVIVAPTHRSMLDTTWMVGVAKRRLRFMGKASFFSVPGVSHAFRALGAYSVNRDGSDREALKISMDLLAQGEALVIYPEGGRRSGPEIGELQPGAAYLSIRAQVPIVPVAIAGSEETFRSRPQGRRLVPGFGRGVILVGEPITPPAMEGRIAKRAQIDELSAQLRQGLQVVFDEANALRTRA